MSDREKSIAFIRLQRCVEEVIASSYGTKLLQHLNVPVYQVLTYGCPPDYNSLWSLLNISNKFNSDNTRFMRQSLAKLNNVVTPAELNNFVSPATLALFDEYDAKYCRQPSRQVPIPVPNNANRSVSFDHLKQIVHSILSGPCGSYLLSILGIEPYLMEIYNIWELFTSRNQFCPENVKPMCEALEMLGPGVIDSDTIRLFKEYKYSPNHSHPQGWNLTPNIPEPPIWQEQSFRPELRSEQNPVPNICAETPRSAPISSPPMENKSEAGNCVVCLDDKSGIVFIPCGHVCTCKECSASLTKCPMCRNKIQQKHPIYLS